MAYTAEEKELALEILVWYLTQWHIDFIENAIAEFVSQGAAVPQGYVDTLAIFQTLYAKVDNRTITTAQLKRALKYYVNDGTLSAIEGGV